MARLSISEAARVAGVARSTLHRAIRAGRLSAAPDGQIDTAELLRAGYTLQRSTPHRQGGALQDAPPRSSDAQQAWTPVETLTLTDIQHERDLLRMERDLLRRELEAAQIREQTAVAREQDAREERQALREREALLLRMLHEAQQRYDRLLDAPRSPSPPEAEPHPVPIPAPGRTEPLPGVVDVTTHMPAYNPDTHTLGGLCKRGHNWQGTGQSLRRKRSQVCVACDAEGQRQRRQERRQDGSHTIGSQRDPL